ncbi:MAG: MBOAT family protein [Clostridiales bacterium]|nr:MBOAT family protein [Clostridiales bacterium]
MLFSSIIFLFYFLPIVLAAYFITPKKYMTARNIILLAASLLFYSWGEPVYVFLMIYSAFFNYFMALEIAKDKRHGGTGRNSMLFTLVVNLFILCFFKYFGFLMDTINSILGTDFHYTALALPIGISFYTFQALSYIFDVYRDRVKPQYSLLKFSLYLSLFPELIAGPIVKYRDVAEQLEERTESLEKFGTGSIRFIYGLGKKVLLANNLGALHTAIIALPDSQVSVVTYWIGIIAYTLQIYFDFSGYSDMAIGLGRMFGFEFMENFNYPYISKTITEFWRRWHISLSTWFREYLYIPLGGNRVPVHRHILNLMIVWSLTGLWHGASWNFVMWGTYYGVLLILEKYIYGQYLEKAPSWAQHIYAMLIVMIGWVFFSSTDLSTAISYIGVLFGVGAFPFANMTTLYLLRTNLVLLVLSGVLSTPEPRKQFQFFNKNQPVFGIVIIFVIFILSVAYLIYSSYNPFLYFRF